MIKRCLILAIAACVLIAFAGTADAATVQTGQACYRAVGPNGVSVDVSGSGFTPGELVSAEIPDKDGLMGFADGTVAADGSLALTIDNVFPPSIDPVAYQETLQIKDVLTGTVLTSAPFYLTNLTVTSKIRHGKAKLRMSGFRPGRQIFAHYLLGKRVITAKLGKASGPCGLLKTKTRLPFNKVKSGKFITQFDNSRKYSRKAAPHIRVKFFRF